MTEEKIQMFMMSKQKYFDASQVPLVTEALEKIGDDKLTLISSADYKDPTMMILISVFLGSFGVDRFMLGDKTMGIVKLLTFGCFGILTIIDWFSVMGKARQKNFETFMAAVNIHSGISGTKQKPKENDNIKNIKEYKDLLDSGIITAEEFEDKKKQILGL